jgi:hypothetical protein
MVIILCARERGRGCARELDQLPDVARISLS